MRRRIARCSTLSSRTRSATASSLTSGRATKRGKWSTAQLSHISAPASRNSPQLRPGAGVLNRVGMAKAVEQRDSVVIRFAGDSGDGMQLTGVSGFQVHFADHDILTPGDSPDVLVAMNPAALKTNLKDLPKGGTLIVNLDAFSERNLQKAGYTASPLEDGSLADYNVVQVPLTSMTVEAV